jgi:myo-inositol-1(or 4)-monophosphatase
MGNYLDTAVSIARESGALLAEMYKTPLEISYKRPSDLVTEADKRSEKLIIERLHKTFPTHAVISEEGGGQKIQSDYCWHVDPLDGTTNFAHKFPVFCVTLGLAYKDEIVAGVVYDPTREEMFNAEQGAGAFLNGQRIHVSKYGKLSESLLATGFPPFDNRHDINIELFLEFTHRSHGIRRAGSAALDLCSVASGRFEAFWELRLNSWDKAAGMLMIAEAGGRVTTLHGERQPVASAEIFGSNGLVHDEMLPVFKQVLGGHSY